MNEFSHSYSQKFHELQRVQKWVQGVQRVQPDPGKRQEKIIRTRLLYMSTSGSTLSGHATRSLVSGCTSSSNRTRLSLKTDMTNYAVLSAYLSTISSGGSSRSAASQWSLSSGLSSSTRVTTLSLEEE
ncbi:hypothetical protein F7725_024957 [Dissostichus mawsoni]|uniref:Uncharacterized protein n=1 Tax=Dissostichus mawsoni TaxID=36200 RepID=A0A7J5XAA2_DISMA|nr:hypothetical protein F7725_024957 [Dissostichus mawsoni]